VITATEQVNFDQIIVSLKGEGRVYPSHYGKILSYVRGPKYAGHHHGEVYCAKSTILLDNRNQLTRQTLPAGEHRFPFCFRLTGSRLCNHWHSQRCRVFNLAKRSHVFTILHAKSMEHPKVNVLLVAVNFC